MYIRGAYTWLKKIDLRTTSEFMIEMRDNKTVVTHPALYRDRLESIGYVGMFGMRDLFLFFRPPTS